jgi:hypothetical protein
VVGGPGLRTRLVALIFNKAVSDQLSALISEFQEFFTTRRITCRVGVCRSMTARKMLMHLSLTANG